MKNRENDEKIKDWKGFTYGEFIRGSSWKTVIESRVRIYFVRE